MTVRSWFLIALVLAMTVVIVRTWGSLGSAVLVFCLIMMAASLVYQKFLTNRDEDDFRSE